MTTVPASPALAFRAVTVRYEGTCRDVLHECTFSVAAGERVGLLGLNGSGKTTVLLAAAGLVPHAGEIRIGGVRLEGSSLTSLRSRIGFLFSTPEDQLLFPRVEEDVAFGLSQLGMGEDDVRKTVAEELAGLGIRDLALRSVYELSHGQKLRVALAGVLVTQPSLLLLDEPSAALDPPSKRSLVQLLCSRPSAALIATHDIAFAQSCCSRFIILEEGNLVSESLGIRDIASLWETDRAEGS